VVVREVKWRLGVAGLEVGGVAGLEVGGVAGLEVGRGLVGLEVGPGG
jgi:hypothetical protein